MNPKWTKDWPTKEAWYWFYGWRFGFHQECKDSPELSPVEIWHDANKKPMYVTRGHFLSKAEGADGLWCKCDIPSLPNLKPSKKGDCHET